MGNEISIAGFGQCGSQIALDISASFDPRVLFGIEGLPNFKFGLDWKRVWKSGDNDSSPSIKLRPNVYIGDLNANNEVYNKVTKNKLFKEYFSKNENATPKQAIVALSQNVKSRQFGFTDEDEKLATKIKSDPSFVDTIESLQFQNGNTPLLALGGAGGLQYLSELIASKDQSILKELPTQADGMLMGIFSLGGGTGAGSLFHILSQYKKVNSRYTLGIGILPDETENARFTNAGRYLVKFLSSDVANRFDTLFLFSNRAAYMALEEASGNERMGLSRDIVNSYIIEFAHDFSILNDVATRSIKGKTFDYMDGKRFNTGTFFVGYSHIDGGSPLDLFISAISPMSFSKDNLSGLSVVVREEKENNARISDLIEQAVRNVAKSSSADSEIQELNDITRLYKSAKYITINYFCPNADFSKTVDDISSKLLTFLRILSNAKIEVDINVFHNKSLKRNSCQVLFGRSLSYEIYYYVFDYIRERFFKEAETGYEQFMNDVGEILERSLSQVTGEQLRLIQKELEICVDKSGISDNEVYSEKDMAPVKGNDIIGKIIGENDIRSVLLNKDHVKRALINMVELASTVPNPPKPKYKYT